MISSLWVELCGYGHGTASGWKSTGRGTKLQIRAPRAANVPCDVGEGDFYMKGSIEEIRQQEK